VSAFERALAAPPRVGLGHFPTPIEPLDNLSRALGSGARIYAKRDDQTGLGLGGNKVRKLEFLVGEALEAGADTLITTGGVQSNHARQTAAAELMARTAELLGLPATRAGRLDLRDDWLGEGYGLPTEAMREAVSLTARSEGLLLDPVYTGKAMAGLIGSYRQGKLPGGNVLFWHTGGAPGLFAYPELVPLS